MESVLSVFESIGRYLSLIRIADVVDVAIMAFVVYKIIGMMKRTRVGNIVKGVGVILLALWLSSETAFNLQGVNYILAHVLEWGVLALVILFQPEIRQLLESVGAKNIKLLNILTPEHKITEMEQAIEQTVVACTEMSRSRTGVLIVFERKNRLDEMIRTGTTLDASVSCELLKNIFFIKAPLHDGAVIIRDGRILSAGCVLPLSKNANLSRDLGMRHRVYRHERELRCGGRHCFRRDRFHFRGSGRHAQASPEAGDAGPDAAQRADAQGGRRRREAPLYLEGTAASWQKGGAG